MTTFRRVVVSGAMGLGLVACGGEPELDPDGMPAGYDDVAYEESSSAAALTALANDEPQAVAASATMAKWDYVGIVGTGQSLSVGSQAPLPISTRQAYGNLKLYDTRLPPVLGGSVDHLRLVPLTERIRPHYTNIVDVVYPNNIRGESPHTAMANQVSAIEIADVNQHYVTVHSVVGESGHGIADLRKGGTGEAYAATLFEANAIKTLARRASKTFGYGAIILTHGEHDQALPSYGSEIYKLWQNYNTDLKAITGQSESIPMFLTQQSSSPPNSKMRPKSTLAQWRLGVDNPGKIFCVGPKYQYEYAVDHLHLTAAGYRRMGVKYGQIYDQVVVKGRSWKPLQPRSAHRSGNAITVDFDVPVAPLEWDGNISGPHRSNHVQWSQGRGFEVWNSAGTPLTITSSQISGSSVVLTLSSDPRDRVTVAYAMTQDGEGFLSGPITGRRGLLRDSDAFVGIDRQTITATVTRGSNMVTGAFSGREVRDVVMASGLPGDTIVTAKPSSNVLQLSSAWTGPSGQGTLTVYSDQHNYAVQFEMPVP